MQNNPLEFIFIIELFCFLNRKREYKITSNLVFILVTLNSYLKVIAIYIKETSKEQRIIIRFILNSKDFIVVTSRLKGLTRTLKRVIY